MISADRPALIISVVWGGGGRESLEVRDEEGRVGKGGVISLQPELETHACLKRQCCPKKI